ncbi:AvrE-family type 3 secretion system effector [Enterobacteriaceae bacterium EKM102V]|uniref:AvrE-family type 3 secretion system effector n=1 Tax=Pantoea TaxID=53335 RepID=UPI00142D8244|nr:MULTISPECIES: AvrE-family type 3 secretion system effector [Pantoea]KAF6662719.1 AvrE-family type 3 secretion system effector [Enterobacteriaceae bacterium EKM102V]KAF6671185.1 AvrE-family type 3 secretion system effector [Pantoea sp. EKM103V]
MAIHLPFSGSLRATQSVSPARSDNAIPLRQFSRRPQQTAGGALHQEVSRQPVPALRQRAADARQRIGSLRQSLSRLRDKCRRQPPPDVPESTRPPELNSRDLAAERRHSDAAPEVPPLRPMTEPEPWPSRRRHLLSPIAEERYSALQESQRNSLQQQAFRAAEEEATTGQGGLQPQSARLALAEDGTLNVIRSASESLTALLSETLASPQFRWLAHQASDDDCQHGLIAPDGRLFSLQGSPTMFIGLTSSRPMPAWPQLTAPQRLAALPDAAVSALMTGIFHHAPQPSDDEETGMTPSGAPVSEQWREHGGRLYRLNDAAMCWEQVDKEEEKSFSRLSRQPDGMLYAIYDKKSLHNLSSGEKSAKTDKITAYCVGSHGAALLLLSDEKTAGQSVMLLSRLSAKKEEQQKITLSARNQAGDRQAFHATGVALHHRRLYALNSEGTLWSAAFPPAQPGSEIVLQPDLNQTVLSEQLGAGVMISSLVSHRDGELMAVVKSEADQKHLCVLNAQGRFEARWNLSESLVLDHHNGLLQPHPLAHERVDTGRTGQLTVHEGKLYAWDKNAGRWEASQEKADTLKRAQDGNGWVIRDGLPSRVKISQKSDRIDGAHHRFALRQLNVSLSVELPLPGFDENNKARAIAPLDGENCAAISENNTLQYHRTQAGRRQAHRMMQTLTKAGIANALPHTRATLPANGEGNTLTDITTDQNRSLYLLDIQGRLWTMPEADWRASPGSRPDARWQPVTLPPQLGPLARLHNSASGALMVVDKEGRSAIWQLAATSPERAEGQPDGAGPRLPLTDENRWRVMSASELTAPPPGVSRQTPLKAIARLDEASKSVNVRGMTLKAETTIAGMSGRDGNHVNSRLRDRLGAHLLNTRMTTPRPLKNAWYATRHHWQGREGLRPLYAQQADLYERLKTLLATPDAAAYGTLQARLAALDTRAFDRTFIDHLHAFIDTVADSVQHHSSQLGQHSGALHGDGSEKEAFHPSRLRAATQAINPYSDDENLLARLDEVCRRYPLREGRPAAIGQLHANGVVARHQKARPPLGRMRDPHDEMGLVKSRLILDGLMMAALHDVVDQMAASVDHGQASPTQIAAIKARLRLLRDEEYGENLVQKATAQGFVNNRQLEACYDAMKSFINALSKPHHGLNMTTRTVLKASDQQQMAAQLLTTLNALEPGENVGFGRNYGGMVTLSVIPGGEVIGIPGVRGNLDRAYSASFARGESGINVTFSRNGGGTGTVFGAAGWNPLSQPDATTLPASGGNRSIVPSLRLGGMVAIALQRQLQNSVSFTLSEAELQPFITQLIQGELHPGELLEKGVSHKVKQGTTLTFNVDATAMALASGGLRYPISGGEGRKNRVMIRAGGMAQMGTNILNAQRERATTRSEAGSTLGRSDNRLRMFNTVSASIGLNGGVGITASPSSGLRIPLFGVNSTTIQASMDNRTRHSMSIDIARAEPVHRRQLEKLIEQTETHFDDPQTNALLQALRDADKAPEKVKSEGSAGLNVLLKKSLSERQAHPGTLRPLSEGEKKRLEALNKADGTTTASEQARSDRFSTFLQDESQATANRLDKLLTHLLALTPAGNGQYGVINSARALDLQRRAHALHCHQLNSAEYQSTYSNLRKVDRNNLMHVVHSLFASELPESAAEAISRFMEEKPMLKAIIRELQENRNTQAVVTLELHDEQRYALQQAWLRQETQPETVAALLRDRTYLRVKSIGFSETNTKQEGISVPLFVAGGSSAASVSISRNLGKITFNYGVNQRSPVAFTLEGDITHASQTLVDALTNAGQQDKRGRR